MVTIALNESQTFSNISATTSAFTLRGGMYAVTITATGYGTVTLQRRAADNSTYVTALTAFAADGLQTSILPPGTYRLAVSSATAIYVDIVSIASAT